MNNSLITVRYAKALYQLAREEKKKDEILGDINMLLDTISESDEFANFLNNPLLMGSDKLKTIDKLFKAHIDNLTLKFLHLLIDKKRENYLNSICRHIIYLYKQERGIQEAVITTANPLSEDHKKEIHDYISKKFKIKIELSERVDPDIIGGFVLRIEDQQINASLSNQLTKIKRELINT